MRRCTARGERGGVPEVDAAGAVVVEGQVDVEPDGRVGVGGAVLEEVVVGLVDLQQAVAEGERLDGGHPPGRVLDRPLDRVRRVLDPLCLGVYTTSAPHRTHTHARAHTHTPTRV
jgi:hypothetical protein